MNFGKFLQTLFLKNTYGQTLLKIGRSAIVDTSQYHSDIPSLTVCIYVCIYTCAFLHTGVMEMFPE